MSIVIVGAGRNLGARIAPGADHEPADVAEILWRHHTDRRVFQTRLGID